MTDLPLPVLTLTLDGFTCSMEGFVAPFEAMRAIQQELLAGGLDAGAAQPLGDRLRRIAETATGLPVAATTRPGGVVLRAVAATERMPARQRPAVLREAPPQPAGGARPLSRVDQIRQLIGGSGLDDRDETALAAELAGIERDAAPAVPKPVGPKPVGPKPVGPSRVAAGEPPLSRLMEEADAKLQHRRAASQRGSIAHLRAVVAASGPADGDPRAALRRPSRDKFRADLAEFVAGGDGDSGGGDPAATGEDRAAPEIRLAPLILIAEQRVDPDGAPLLDEDGRDRS